MREILKEMKENVIVNKRKSREFVVKRPRGELHKSFKYISFDAVFLNLLLLFLVFIHNKNYFSMILICPYIKLC